MDARANLTPGQWHTMKVTWGPGGMSLSANGQLVAHDPAALTPADMPLHLGDFPADGRSLGIIGEIRNVKVAGGQG